MRQIFIDTETTGLDPLKGHRIIELAAVEMIDRKLTGNNFHAYINPERKIDPGAAAVHGITDEMVKCKPLFKDIADDFIEFIYGEGFLFPGSLIDNRKDVSELIMHNAKFDMGHINNEFNLLNKETGEEKYINSNTLIKCTLQMAWAMDGVEYVKGYKLDQLMIKYGINIERKDHGALLDATILAHVYLAMTKKWYL
jgi:DNA polymerase III subunit epsilon